MATQAPGAVADRLVEQLDETRAGMRRYRWTLGLAWTALAAALLACALVVVDWNWVLKRSTRAAGLASLAALTLVVFDRVALRPRRLLRRAEAAAEVEASFPDLGQRVRTTVEYIEPTPETAPAAPDLVRALRQDTDRRTRDLDFGRIVPWRHLRGPLAGLALLAAACGLVLVARPEFRTAALRFVLLPAHYTTLGVEPGDQTVKAGDVFTLRATLSGRPVASARWLRRPREGRRGWTVVSLSNPATKDDGPPRPRLGTLTGTLNDCQDDFEYRVTAGEVESPTYCVKVIHPLKLQALEVKVEPPAYTRKAPSTGKDGNIQVIEGSNVRFRFTLDRAPAEATLVVTPGKGGGDGSEAASPFTTPLAITGSALTGTLPKVARPVEYQVRARAGDGMELEPRTYTIRVRFDEKPTLRFINPPEELSVIPTTEVPVRVEAADDFGLAELRVVYRIGKGPKETLLLNTLKGQPVTAEALATLYLEKHQVDYTDGLTYYAYALDNYPPTPHRTTTELRFIDILPFRQEFQLCEGGGTCNGSSVTLEELILRQRTNLNRTFAASEDPGFAPGSAKKIAAAERELAGLTADFTHRMEEKFGPIPSLHEAADAMLSASAALEKADAGAATPAEETALSGLIKARQNLRKLLKQNPSASACRKIDRQQLQKIRKPPLKKNDSPIARLMQDLKALAQEERKVCDGLNPKPGAGARPGADPEPSPTQRQDAAVHSAKQLQKTVRDDPALSDLARDRMDTASGTVRKSAEALHAGDPGKAAGEADDAAGQLERLAEQVEGLKARDLAQNLARARDLAGKLSAGQKDLGRKPGPGPATGGESPCRAGEQGRLAEGAGTLADWLRRLPAEADDESRELGRSLRQATRANPPQEIADAMRRAAGVPRTGRDSGEAARAADEAARRLEALARDLDNARRAFVQPQLDQVIAAEAQAARTRKALATARDEAGKAEAEKAMTGLLQTLEKLRGDGGPLAQAVETLRDGMRQNGGWGEPRRSETREVVTAGYVPPVGYTRGVSLALRALQAKIQELVLRNAQMDRDEAVPPEYKALVEDYYRALSEDLR